uniref:Protein kinase domain-containing protein n=1 Tax=Pithovirus LCDPAC02 TaxID=2506601 RepID=A0A481YNK2_9VIRU|nr:MAG: uncharacterized protein LCDPAC02_00710 [Pithovirus LCDPAC02]
MEDVLNYNNEYIKRIEKEYDNYNFNIEDISLCNTDKKFMEMLGYYVRKAFQNKNIKNILEYEERITPSVFILSFKENKYFKYKNKIKLIMKRYSILSKKYALNEYNIGVKISELRDKVPNFVFYFPMIISNNEISFAKTDGYYKDDIKHIILLMEHLQGHTLDAFLLNFEDIPTTINIFLQIILALNAINQYYDFEHKALHFGNIIIQKLDKERILTYKVKMKGKIVNINLKVYYLVKIFDYDKSYLGKKTDDDYATTEDLIHFYDYHKFKSYIPEDIREYISKIISNEYDTFLHKLIYKSGINKYLDFSKLEYTEFDCNKYLVKGKNIEFEKGNLYEIKDIIDEYFYRLYKEIESGINIDKLNNYVKELDAILNDIIRLDNHMQNKRYIKDKFKYLDDKYFLFFDKKLWL